MAYTFNGNFYLEIARGNVAGMSVVHKFGRHAAVSTTLAPIAFGGNHSFATSAVTLEAISTSGQDSSSGAGLRTISINGLDSSFNDVTETVTMNGVSATSATSNSFIRINSITGATTGTYATASKLNNNGIITVRQSGAGSTWSQISNTGTGYGIGMLEDSWYCVPNGYTAYIDGFTVSVEDSNAVNLFLFQRPDADDVSAPFSAMPLVRQWNSITGFTTRDFLVQMSFPAKTDFGFFAKTVAGTASVSIAYEIILIAD